MLRTTALVIGLLVASTPARAPTPTTTSPLNTPPSDPACGTILATEDVAFARALNDAGLYLTPPPESVLQVPLALHIVRRSNGTGGIDTTQLITAIANLNTTFSQAGILFYIQGKTDEIWDDHFYTGIASQADIDTLRQTNRDENAINLYFTESFAGSTGPLCGISSFSFSAVQGIVLSNGCAGVSYNRATFPHEIGHYFDLYHTHETAFGPECSTGTNCQTTGDLICDTPADPRIGYHNINGGCNYVGLEVDPCTGGATYAPDVLNVMSASPRLCRTRFSPEQIGRMRAALVNLRPHLLQGCPADLDASGSLDIFDYLAFQTRFAQGDPAADLNLDARFDVFDFLDFQTLFVGGCP
jgi:Pregnancy-associated plasma protein-A